MRASGFWVSHQVGKSPATRTTCPPAGHADDEPAVGLVGQAHEFGVDEVEGRGLHGPRIEVAGELAGGGPAPGGRLERASGVLDPVDSQRFFISASRFGMVERHAGKPLGSPFERAYDVALFATAGQQGTVGY